MTDASLVGEALLADAEGPAEHVPFTPSPPSSATLSYRPWRSTCDPTERGRQLRSRAALTSVYLGPHHPLLVALRAGGSDPVEFIRAQALVEVLPSLHRRRMLSVFSRVAWVRR